MQERVYEPLLGDQSALTGASLQNAWNETHERTHKWVTASAAAGRPWVVANDEQGSARTGGPPDPARHHRRDPLIGTAHDRRRYARLLLPVGSHARPTEHSALKPTRKVTYLQ